MAQIVITNIHTEAVHLGDFYKTLAVGETITLENRDPNELSGMPTVQTALAAAQISLVITPSADELASGLLTPKNAVEAQDFQAVAAADPAAPIQVIYKAFAAGTPGTPDDVVIYAANALPYKMRVLDVIGFVATNIAAETVKVNDEAAGAGTDAATLDYGAATGRVVDAAVTATTVYTPGATKGLFLRRSDQGVAGEVLILVRRES
jgi:hypothetical protein